MWFDDRAGATITMLVVNGAQERRKKEEELQRVILWLRQLPTSEVRSRSMIQTSHPCESAKVGAHIINDIRSFRTRGSEVAAETGLPVCLMAGRREIKDMQSLAKTMSLQK